MVVQAIALLDDLDKEINIYAMRVKVSSLTITRELFVLIFFRNGTGGISPKLRKSSWTTLRTLKS